SYGLAVRSRRVQDLTVGSVGAARRSVPLARSRGPALYLRSTRVFRTRRVPPAPRAAVDARAASARDGFTWDDERPSGTRPIGVRARREVPPRQGLPKARSRESHTGNHA